MLTMIFSATSIVFTTPHVTPVTTPPYCGINEWVRLNDETIDRFGVLVTGQHMDTIRQAITSESILHYDLNTSASSPETVTFDMRRENGYKLMKVEFETQFVEEVQITIERADDVPVVFVSI